MIRKILLSMILSAASGCMLIAAEWRGLNDENWYSGTKLKPEDLQGKVVMVECWGIHCGPCLGSLPHMENLWKKFKSKPFMLIGSHCQGREPEAIRAVIASKKLTYPIYQGVSMQGAPGFGGIPFAYIVDDRGEVLWYGNPFNKAKREEAIDVIGEAIQAIGHPPSLVSGVKLKYFKMFKKNLELGQDISGVKKRLQEGAKNPKADVAAEAQAILAAIEKSKDKLREEIAALKASEPKEAEKLLKLYKKTYKK